MLLTYVDPPGTESVWVLPVGELIGRSGRYTLGLLHEYRGTSSHFRVLGPLSRLYEAVEPACAACLRLIWPPNVRSLRPLRRNRGGYTYDGPDEPVATYRCRWALVPLRTPCGTVGPARDACLRPAGPRRGRVSCTDLVASCCVAARLGGYTYMVAQTSPMLQIAADGCCQGSGHHMRRWIRPGSLASGSHGRPMSGRL